jgi:hypothetical protein
MLGADTFVSSILRLVSTVVILAAVYFLIIKPVLSTTKDVVHNASKQASQQQRASRIARDRAELHVARQRASGYAQSALAGSQPWFAASHEIRHCIQAAGTDLAKMNRCASEGVAIVTRALSPRNISVSYATSLDQQGKSPEADRVRKCLDAAGFRVRPMIRCRALATRYLFG